MLGNAGVPRPSLATVSSLRALRRAFGRSAAGAADGPVMGKNIFTSVSQAQGDKVDRITGGRRARVVHVESPPAVRSHTRMAPQRERRNDRRSPGKRVRSHTPLCQESFFAFRSACDGPPLR